MNRHNRIAGILAERDAQRRQLGHGPGSQAPRLAQPGGDEARGGRDQARGAKGAAMKPSEFGFSSQSMCCTYGKREMEIAAIDYVLACAERGDEWQAIPLDTFDFGTRKYMESMAERDCNIRIGFVERVPERHFVREGDAVRATPAMIARLEWWNRGRR